jgi:hypothetical protein
MGRANATTRRGRFQNGRTVEQEGQGRIEELESTD